MSNLKSRIVLIVCTLLPLFSACTLATADFSAYDNRNLIPEAQFDSWIPDQDLVKSPGAQYMGMERLDSSAAADFTSATGFADLDALYGTLPDSAKTESGSRPPVYRLEIKNLFKDGDFEASVPGASSQNTNNVMVNIPGNIDRFEGWNSADPYFRDRIIMAPTDPLNKLASGQALFIRQSFNDWTRIDLSKNLTAWDSGMASYNLGFRMYLVNPLEYYLSIGDDTDNYDVFHVFSNAANVVRRFPQEMTDGTVTGTTSTFYASDVRRYLYINPVSSSLQAAIPVSSFDDFQIVRTDRTYAIRYEVPKTTASNLELPQGGKYSLSLWLRNDPTAIQGNANKSLNRYPAEKISLSVMDDIGNTSSYWNNRVVVAAPTTGDWTLVTASFTNMLYNSSKFAAALPTDKILQLTIAVTDTTSDATQFPGSILITSPRLVFSEKP